MITNEFTLVMDFDGTITQQDSNDMLVRVLGNEVIEKIESEFVAGTLSNREASDLHFKEMLITLEEYQAFLDAHISIDPGFDKFLELARDREISLFIVSGGYHQAVEHILGNKRLQGVQVFANSLLGSPYLSISFGTTQPVCDKPFGPCGNCKRDCLASIRQMTDRKIIFVGDGLTDRCALEEADFVFAKDSLADYCNEHGLQYTSFKDFSDIIDNLGWRTV